MLNESLHHTEYLENGDFFLKAGSACTKIARLQKGVARGFVYDNDGNEITTHFYQDGDMIIGSFMPKVKASLNIQAMEHSELSVADYSAIMSFVNKDKEITEVINREFQKQNTLLQNRLVTLLNLSSVEKYEHFLNQYPGLINRIPHYFIANYLGITPTQLSRARKQFINKCK